MTFSSDEELKKGFITREHIHEGLEVIAKQAREANIAKLPDEASKRQAGAIPQSRLVLWLHGRNNGLWTAPRYFLFGHWKGFLRNLQSISKRISQKVVAVENLVERLLLRVLQP